MPKLSEMKNHKINNGTIFEPDTIALPFPMDFPIQRTAYLLWSLPCKLAAITTGLGPGLSHWKLDKDMHLPVAVGEVRLVFFSRPMNKGGQEDFDSDWAEDNDAMSNGAANRGALDCFF